MHEAGRELAQQRQLMREPRLPVGGLQLLTQAGSAEADGLQLQFQLRSRFFCIRRTCEQSVFPPMHIQKRRKRRQDASSDQSDGLGECGAGKSPKEDAEEQQNPCPA